jgi:hypothetical protein
MLRPFTTVCRSAFSILIALLCAQPSVAGTPESSSCEVLLPSDVHRRAQGFVAETHCYRLDLPSPGLLHLDLSVAGGSASRARLTMTAAGGSPAALDTVWRSAAERLQLAPSGSYLLEVSAEDPRRPLPAYRLSSRFAATDKSETDGELEIDPLPFSGGAHKSETDGELEIDPLPLQALCKDGDDHGDTFACATAIPWTVAGEIDNGWGDDVDVFRFRVRDWQTLEIAIAGSADIRGELYDGAGQRLAGDGDGGDGDGFRLVRTLGPGPYFVRVEGGSRGTYSLEVRSLDG